MADPTTPPVYSDPPPPKVTADPSKEDPRKNYNDPRKSWKPPTRMAPAVAPARRTRNPDIPHVYDPRLDKVAKIAKKAPPKPITVAGTVNRDDQFNGTVTFSPAYGEDAGRTYGASLGLTPGAESPEGDQPFYVRLSIEQHRVDPLLQAFQTTWEPPPGWSTIDGAPSVLYDEAISNPLQITRVYQSPAAPSSAIGFRVRITKKYRP